MKNKINGILTVQICAASGSVALYNSHYNGQGFSSIVYSTTIEGTFGSIVHMIAEDLRQYQNATEG